jgi:hypothetical protein
MLKKKKQPICQLQYPKPPMRCTNILSPLNEKDNNSNICEIAFQIFKKPIDMKLGVKISFDQFLSNLHLSE